MTIEFFMNMKPPTVTAQEKKVAVRNGKPIFYEPAPLKKARQELKWNLLSHRPTAPIDAPIKLTCIWHFKPTRGHKHGEYRITKPDTDNLQKLLKDCMTHCGFWKDDALVCSEHCEKFWSDIEGIYIKIEMIA